MPNPSVPRPDVEGIEARAKAATDGVWYAGKLRLDDNGISQSLTIGSFEADEHYENTICEVWDGDHIAEANGRFITHARQDIPALIAYISRLEAAVKAARVFGGWQNIENELELDKVLAALGDGDG